MPRAHCREIDRTQRPALPCDAILTRAARLSTKFGTFAAAQAIKAIPRVRLSAAVGSVCELGLPARVSRLVAGGYSRAFGVDLSEAEAREGAYPSFDTFFTRALRDGVRPISSDPLVSPADGQLSARGPVDAGSRVFVKGQPYEVGELIGDPHDAARYCGGSFAVVYLSPRDYHRVHAPVDGRVSLVRHIAGDLYPVNAIGERWIPRLFVRNHRVALAIDTERLGRVTVVMVGAVIVGKISVSVLPEPTPPYGDHALDPACPVQRGQELGMFHLGSTVVMLVEPTLTVGRREGTIRYGESLL